MKFHVQHNRILRSYSPTNLLLMILDLSNEIEWLLDSQFQIHTQDQISAITSVFMCLLIWIFKNNVLLG